MCIWLTHCLISTHCLSRSVPNAKSTLVARICPHLCHLTDPPQDFSDLFSLMDQFRSRPTGPMGRAVQTPSRPPVQINPPHPRRDSGLPRSRGHHVTIAQPRVTHATSSVDPLADGPRP